jgi:predicted secreted protein
MVCWWCLLVCVSPVSTSRKKKEKNVPGARDASASRAPYVVVASAMLAALRVHGNAEVVGVGGDTSRWRVGNVCWYV